LNKRAVAIFVISISICQIWELLEILNVYDVKTLTILKVISYGPLIFSSYKLLNGFNFESNYFKAVFSLFLVYEFVTIIRGWSFSYDNLKGYLENGTILWPFIIPMVVFFNKNIENFGILIKWIFIIGLISLFISLISPALLLQRPSAQVIVNLATPCGFLLLNATYLSNRKVNTSFIIIFILLLSLTYLARRSGVGTLSGFIISAYLLNLMNKSRALLFKIFPMLICCLIFILLSFSKFTSVLTNKFEERLYEDTRSGLFESFLFQMNEYMVFGKGMGGTYYYPMGGGIMDDGVTPIAETEYRDLIENGYLQLLLTGGLLQIILFLAVLLPAGIIGIFRSHNQFSKASGIVILLWLGDMAVYGLPTFTMHYFLVWICVGICYSSTIRMKSDAEIRAELY
jgi:hypothetical protein